ncbi:MAG: hypothetical protein QXI33_00655 [Candidatus Pacearchaeota archaeon]
MSKKRKLRNKFYFYSILLIISLLFFLSFINAQSDNPKATEITSGANSPKGFVDSIVLFVNQVINLFTQVGNPLFSTLLGNVGAGGDLFTKVLIFFLVVIVTIAVLDNVDFFNGRIWLQIGVGSIISILGIRFIPNDMIQSIILPSGAYVAALTMIIPLALYFYVMEKFIPNFIIRRIGWILFAVAAVILWGYNYNKPFYWIYPITTVICIVLFFIDGTLNNWMSRAKAKRSLEHANSEEIELLESRMKATREAIGRARDPAKLALLQKQYAEQKKALKALTSSRYTP